MSAAGWERKARMVAHYDNKLGDLLSVQEREQVNAIIDRPREPYHTVKAMIERKLTEGAHRMRGASP